MKQFVSKYTSRYIVKGIAMPIILASGAMLVVDYVDSTALSRFFPELLGHEELATTIAAITLITAASLMLIFSTSFTHDHLNDDLETESFYTEESKFEFVKYAFKYAGRGSFDMLGFMHGDWRTCGKKWLGVGISTAVIVTSSIALGNSLVIASELAQALPELSLSADQFAKIIDITTVALIVIASIAALDFILGYRGRVHGSCHGFMYNASLFLTDEPAYNAENSIIINKDGHVTSEHRLSFGSKIIHAICEFFKSEKTQNIA